MAAGSNAGRAGPFGSAAAKPARDSPPVSDSVRDHWEKVHSRRPPEEMSWYQASPVRSLELIHRIGLARTAPIVDIGAGASLLVDRLLEEGFGDLTIVDVAESALDRVRERLGPKAGAVTLLAADVTRLSVDRRFALWHDRAVFHFLTDPDDRAAYVRCLQRSVEPGGSVIIATFSPDGPPKCSGLEIVRYDRSSLGAALGSGFELVESEDEAHLTPGGQVQHFLWARFRVGA